MAHQQSGWAAGMRSGAMLPGHKKRHHANGTTALAVMILVAACIALGSSPALAKQRAGERTGHFIEFLARPTEYLVDHAFVRIGMTARNGRDREGYCPVSFALSFSAERLLVRAHAGLALLI